MEGNEAKSRLQVNRQQGRYFDGAVDIFDRTQPPHIRQRLKRIVAEARNREGETVLDVGTGVVVLVPFIQAYEAGHILACDVSSRMLARLRQKYPAVETLEGDVRDLALADGCVDVIFMNAVYPNIADKPGALQNCSRMIGDGGRLLISHPEGRSFVDGLRDVVPFPLDPLPTSAHLQELLLSFPLQLVHYIDETGFFLAVVLSEQGERLFKVNPVHRQNLDTRAVISHQKVLDMRK